MCRRGLLVGVVFLDRFLIAFVTKASRGSRGRKFIKPTVIRRLCFTANRINSHATAAVVGGGRDRGE